MNTNNSPVETHYTRDGLYELIVSRLQEQQIHHPTRKNITGIDEFHVRGASVSIELAKEVHFNKNSRVLDIGCGLGGPARMIAEEYGCKVTGIDLTKEFVRSATLLSKLVNLQDLTNFIQADALDLPFERNSFDVVWTQHVQMNIKDKNKFYSEMDRVLQPGGKFVYYDIFKKNTEPVIYPVPWADDASLSFLFTTAELDQILRDAGFKKLITTDETAKGIEFYNEMLSKAAKEGPPKIGLNVLLGDTAQEKFANLFKNFVQNKLELQGGIYQKK